MIRPASAGLAALLWAVHRRLANVPSPPAPGLTSFGLDEDDTPIPEGFLRAAFFRKIGTRAVRLDILERAEDILADSSRDARNAGETALAIVSLLGSANEEGTRFHFSALGWKEETRGSGDDAKVVWQRKHHAKQRHKAPRTSAADPQSGLTIRGPESAHLRT
jgi:ATP-dependent RNA helicase SUPV3L1/SUV3